MVPRSSYPPVVHHDHLTQTLNPSTAQGQLKIFLEKTSTHPHLHPDSLLSTTGITYSAHSGPSGGLAIHHLRRIEAGLRGENLVADTEEELRRITGDDDEGEGDDEDLDRSIARSEEKLSKKRKRTEEIQDWAEETSSQADGAVVPPGREIESFAHTPLHQVDYEGNGEWQDQREYELGQRIVEGEVGEREGAPAERQNVALPKVAKEEENAGGKKELSRKEKEARKKAKKARRMDERAKGKGD